MMKKIWLILAVVLALALIGVGGFFVWTNKNPQTLLRPLSETSEREAMTFTLKDWEDPAGFKFSYPQEVTIDNHQEDEENYASLELTEANHSGRLLIWMKDKKETSLDQWVANQEGDPQVFDSDLGGHPAKKLAFLSPQKLLTAAFDQEVIVLVEVYPEDSWWNDVYLQVLDSFEFIPLPGEDKAKVKAPGAWSGEGGESGIIDEGEETIE
ncbi:hypothetical protein FJZ41_01180 [Candidatus Shapirobacteria bacterium]|nr:hypothetical protein [Candidatus Shapirobacteria bacterium]